MVNTLPGSIKNVLKVVRVYQQEPYDGVLKALWFVKPLVSDWYREPTAPKVETHIVRQTLHTTDVEESRAPQKA